MTSLRGLQIANISSIPFLDRFSRPSIGGRTRPGARTTAAPAAEEHNEEEVSVKEVKPVSSGFGRNKRK